MLVKIPLGNGDIKIMGFCFVLHKGKKEVRQGKSWGSLNKKWSVKNIEGNYIVKRDKSITLAFFFFLPNIRSLFIRLIKHKVYN